MLRVVAILHIPSPRSTFARAPFFTTPSLYNQGTLPQCLTPFVLSIDGADVASVPFTVKVLIDTDNCSMDGFVAHRVVPLGGYTSLLAYFDNVTTMGEMRVCWTTREWANEFQLLPNDAPMYMFPKVGMDPIPQVVEAGVNTSIVITGSGFDPTRIIISLGMNGLRCNTSTYVFVPLDTSNGTRLETASNAFYTAETIEVCLALFNQYIPINPMIAKVYVMGIVPAFGDFQANTSLTLYGFGFNTFPPREGGDHVLLYASSSSSAYANCNSNATAVADFYTLSPVDVLAAQTVVTDAFTALPGNYTVCISAFPTFVAKPVAMLLIWSFLTAFTASPSTVVLAQTVINLTVAGSVRMEFPFSARPILRVQHYEADCSANLSQEEGFVVPTAVPIPTAPPQDGKPTMAPAPLPTSAPWSGATFAVYYLNLHANNNLTSASVDPFTPPVMGKYYVCWSSYERNYVFQALPRDNTSLPLELLVEATVQDYGVKTVRAGASVQMFVTGIGLLAEKMNVSVVDAAQSCDAATMQYSYDSSQSTSSNVTLSLSLTYAGTFNFCVGTLLDIHNMGPITVNAWLENAAQPPHLDIEQYDDAPYSILGGGLSTNDTIYVVTSSSCSSLSSTPQHPTSPAGHDAGLTETLFNLDTKTVGAYSLCYQFSGKQDATLILSFAIFKEVKRVDIVTPQYSDSGTTVRFMISGHGLNASSLGDAFKVIRGQDCASSSSTVMFNTTNLGSSDAFHLLFVEASWVNSSFPKWYPPENFTLCYRLYSYASFSYLSYFLLPFANQEPYFALVNASELPGGSFILYSADQVTVARTLTIVAQMHAGLGWSDKTQSLSFDVVTNATSPFIVQPTISTSGILQATVKANAVSAVSMLITLVDNGGTAYGGVDRTARTTTLQVIYPFNSAPTFTFRSMEAAVLNSDGSVVVFPGFVENILPGPNVWERNQTVTFTITANGTAEQNASVSRLLLASNGTLTLQLSVNKTKYWKRNVFIPIVVVAKDNGGRGALQQERDTSPPVIFTLVIAVFNHAPTCEWLEIMRTQYYVVANEDYSKQIVQNVLAGDEQQTVHFETIISREPPSDPTPFQCNSSVNATTGILQIRCDTAGVFNLEITPVDDGGSYVGGADRGTTHRFTLNVLQPFVLTASPPTGLSMSTLFTFSLSGGLSTLNGKSIYMQLAKVEVLRSPVKASLYVTVCRTGGFVFQTNTVPEGDITFVALVTNEYNESLAFPITTVHVSAMPLTVSFDSLYSGLKQRLDLGDVIASSFGLYSVSINVDKSNDVEMIAYREMFLELLYAIVLADVKERSSHLLPNEALARHGMTLTHLTNTHRLTWNWTAPVAARRQFKVLATGAQFDQSLSLSYAHTRIGAAILDALAVAGDPTSVTRDTVSALSTCAAILMTNVPRASQHSWAAATDAETSNQYDLRHTQNGAATSVLYAAHHVGNMECLRMQIALSQTFFSSITDGVFSMAVDIAPAQEVRRTLTTSGAAATFTFSTASSSSTCFVVSEVADRNLLLSTGDPLTTPQNKIVSAEASSLGSGVASPNAVAACEVQFVNAPFIEGQTYLLAFNNQTSDWQPLDPGRRGAVFIITPSLFAQTRVNYRFSAFSLGDKPSTSDEIVYVAVFLPLLCVLMFAHLIISYVVDAPMRGRFLKEALRELEFLPLHWFHHLMNNWIVASPFLSNVSYRVFPRHYRAVCLWVLIMSPLLLITATLEVQRVDWEYEGNRDHNAGRLCGIGVGMSLVAVVLARILWWLFTSAPDPPNVGGAHSPGSPTSIHATPMTAHEKKTAGAVLLFLLWITACVVYFACIASQFNASVISEMHVIGFFFCLLWGAVWDLCLAVVTVFVTSRYFRPASAWRYVHPSVFPEVPEMSMSPYGMSPESFFETKLDVPMVPVGQEEPDYFTEVAVHDPLHPLNGLLEPLPALPLMAKRDVEQSTSRALFHSPPDDDASDTSSLDSFFGGAGKDGKKSGEAAKEEDDFFARDLMADAPIHRATKVSNEMEEEMQQVTSNVRDGDDVRAALTASRTVKFSLPGGAASSDLGQQPRSSASPEIDKALRKKRVEQLDIGILKRRDEQAEHLLSKPAAARPYSDDLL